MSRYLTFLLLLAFVSSSSVPALKSSNIGNFVSGFANGVQQSTTLEILCIDAYPQLATKMEALSTAISDGEDFATLIHVFQNAVNQLTTFSQICDFQNAIERISALLTTGEGLDIMVILIFTNFSVYQSTFELFKVALANGLYYDAGTNLGILYYKLFG